MPRRPTAALVAAVRREAAAKRRRAAAALAQALYERSAEAHVFGRWDAQSPARRREWLAQAGALLRRQAALLKAGA